MQRRCAACFDRSQRKAKALGNSFRTRKEIYHYYNLDDLMEIELSDIWTVAGFLIGLQIAAFTWRVSREIALAERKEINWLPPADIMNLISLLITFLGVFALPIAGVENTYLPRLALGLSIILFAGYPFALAGHYDLYTKGRRSYDYVTRQEKLAILVTIIAAFMFLVFSILRLELL